MKKLLSILTVCMAFLITACEDDANVDVQTLVVDNCKSTGQSFMGVEHICEVMGRGCIKYKEIPTRFYVYECPSKGRVLSKYKLEYQTP